MILRCKRCKKNTRHDVDAEQTIYCIVCGRRHGVTGIVKYFEGEVIRDVDKETN